MKKVLQYYEEQRLKPKAKFVNAPEFNDSTLLRLFQRCCTSTVKLVTRAIKNVMVNEGAWKGDEEGGQIGYPDPGSMALWVDKEAKDKTQMDVIKRCLKQHFESFRESFRGVSRRGVQTNDFKLLKGGLNHQGLNLAKEIGKKCTELSYIERVVPR